MCVQLAGLPLCLGTDALDLVNHQMVRFLAPVTMLATGGLGQVGASQQSVASRLPSLPCSSCSTGRQPH